MIASYDNNLLLGDFNVERDEANIRNFINAINLKILVRENSCFKYPVNLSCIDLYQNLRNTTIFETRLLDFLKIVLSVFKIHFPKR